MALVDRSVLIEYTPVQMFALVDGVEHYPSFLPWCSGTAVAERTESRTLATIHIRYKGIVSQFSTENTKESPLLMDLRLTDGPFSRLNGQWRFTPLGEAACKVGFRLEYEFSSAVLEKALGPVFKGITESFIESFVKQAGKVYGR
jgi:ribosome-associated toxin RatA of RatAB toxin-antitoxin module